MTKIRSLEAMVLILVMALLAGSAALVLLGSVQTETATTVTVWQSQPVVQEATAIEWTGLGENITVPAGLIINGHATKHTGQVLDAWKIYTYLLEGQCVASAVFCGPSDIEKLYLCVDPTGRIGGIVRFGDEIRSGWQGNQDYWAKKVSKPEWEACND